MDFCGVLAENGRCAVQEGAAATQIKEAILQATIGRNIVTRHSETGTVLIEE